MAKHGKKFTAAAAQVEDRPYTLEEAIPLVQKVKFAKFDETVELAMRLGVDPKHADQMVRGTVVLPHGLGKSKKVLAIAGADKQKEATDAGADFVGGDEIVEKILGGWMDFDAVVATPDMMRARRPARQGARPARPDAEPEDRHRDAERRAGDQGNQGRQGGVPRRQDRHRPRAGRQDVVLRRRTWSTTPTRWSTASSRRSRRRPRASTSSQSPCPPRWARASRSTPRTSTSGAKH